MVGGESITSEEIILATIAQLRPIAQDSNDFEQFKEQVEPEFEEILIIRISNILLYQQAKRQMGEGIDEFLERTAEAKIREFVADSGGDYTKAEQILKQQGMDWNSYKEHQKKRILSQWYVASELMKDRPITYSTLLKYYNEMKDEFFAIQATIKFQLFDIEVAKLAIGDPNQSRKRAQELANDLFTQISKDKDFGTVAEQYSNEKAIVRRVIEVSSAKSLAEPYDILVEQLEKINPREITEPIWSKNVEHIFIMKLEEKRLKGYKPFEQVQREVQDKIISDREKELLAKLHEQAAIIEKSEFVEFCLQEIYQISKEHKS